MPISWEDNKDGSLFFWLAKNRHMKKNEDEKLVVWLNGGPGCSSMIGMMHEHGPFTIETDLDYLSSNYTKDSVPIGLKYKLKNNPYSWNEVANILYVEQPIRTGFSVAAKDKALIAGEDQVAVDFRRFLISFMQVFTEYKGNIYSLFTNLASSMAYTIFIYIYIVYKFFGLYLSLYNYVYISFYCVLYIDWMIL